MLNNIEHDELFLSINRLCEDYGIITDYSQELMGMLIDSLYTPDDPDQKECVL